ncbi:MAG: ATP-binding protein [Bacilli bacterium]|nr:ATP-binding protein [Bacilli bacterium]
MKIIERETYLKELIELKGTPEIKIITGVRRSGKSFLLNQYIDYIKKTDKKNNIIFINFNKIAYDDLKDYKKLYNFIKDKYLPNKNNYLFIDEVQLCPKFEIAINDLFDSKKYDIYLTGSNAFLLSSDLATLFTGRYMEIKVFPFSFKEYLKYFGNSDVYQSFDKYVQEGGFAGSYVYSGAKRKKDYINNVIDVIVLKDIMKKNNVSNQSAMSNLVDYMFDNIGNITSLRNITRVINNNDVSVDHKTIGNYAKFLCEGFVFYKVKRYDIKGGGYLSTNEKYYTVDLGARYARLGNRYNDYGRVYENIVAIELLRRGLDIYVGTLYQKEVDFVVMDGENKTYIQVCDDISNPETFKREYSPLLSIKDAHEKVIITRTKHPPYQFRGIKIIDIADWLLH